MVRPYTREDSSVSSAERATKGISGEIGLPGVELDDRKPLFAKMLRPDFKERCLAGSPSGIDRQDARTFEITYEVGEDLYRLLPPEEIVLEGIVLRHVDFTGLDAYSHIGSSALTKALLRDLQCPLLR